MTLPSSGQLGMDAINAEFGRGLDLWSYRGTPWWTDAGATGYFSPDNLGFYEFYGKRATSPVMPGVKEFAYIGSYAPANNTLSLGADDPKRFIVVCVGTTGGTNGSLKYTECRLDGVNIPLIVNNSNYNTADGVSLRESIFGGYFPTGATATVEFTLSSGAINTNGYKSTYRLVGDNIQTLQTIVGVGTLNLAAESCAVGACVSATGGTAVTWTGLTRNYEVDAGTWRYSVASTYVAAAENRAVNKSAGNSCLASFYSP